MRGMSRQPTVGWQPYASTPTRRSNGARRRTMRDRSSLGAVSVGGAALGFAPLLHPRTTRGTLDDFAEPRRERAHVRLHDEVRVAARNLVYVYAARRECVPPQVGLRVCTNWLLGSTE